MPYRMPDPSKRPAPVRLFEQRDVEGISQLLDDLGYPSSSDEVTARLAALKSPDEQAVFVAARADEICGVCQVQAVHTIATPSYAEILVLVVNAGNRRAGIGRALVWRAIEWAVSNGHTHVWLRSGVHREEAHRFYEAVGFTRAKSSAAFEITL